MTKAKIVKFYVDRAKYFAEDERGNKIVITIDYWNGTYKLSRKNKIVENFAKKLLTSKHRINMAWKLLQ